ncbi:MAG: inositol oxygenase family protein [Thermodesulfobacteriota bacterium]
MRDRSTGDDETGPASPDRGHEAAPRERSRARRRLLVRGLAAAAGAAAGGAAGLALGYRLRTEIRDVKLRLLARPLDLPPGASDFRRDAARILARHRAQTAAEVAALKARYESAVFGRVRVWDLIERLALCVDPTDLRLFCGSQFVHLQQVFAAMVANDVRDPDMLLLALIHDLGKVLLLAGAAPEHVVCGTRRVLDDRAGDGAGFANVVFQFGHGEFLHSRIAGLVPDHVAWVARYHNVNPTDNAHLMDERDRDYAARYLAAFRRFDGDFVSPYYLPRVDLERCRALVESYFPQPILV